MVAWFVMWNVTLPCGTDDTLFEIEKLRRPMGTDDAAVALDAAWPTGVTVGAMQLARAVTVSEPELEEDAGQLLARIGQAAILPVDHTQAAGGGGAQVVRPQIAVAGAQDAGRLDQRLDLDE